MGANRSVINSFSFAFDGIKEAIKEEPNFRFHLFLGIVSLILAYFLGFSTNEWLLLIFTIVFVLALELVNTAVEEVVNIVSPQVAKGAKVAKDVMAAAVLMGAILAVIVGLTLFLPKLRLFL